MVLELDRAATLNRRTKDCEAEKREQRTIPVLAVKLHCTSEHTLCLDSGGPHQRDPMSRVFQAISRRLTAIHAAMLQLHASARVSFHDRLILTGSTDAGASAWESRQLFLLPAFSRMTARNVTPRDARLAEMRGASSTLREERTRGQGSGRYLAR